MQEPDVGGCAYELYIAVQISIQSTCKNWVAVLHENITCFHGRRQRKGYHINIGGIYRK